MCDDHSSHDRTHDHPAVEHPEVESVQVDGKMRKYVRALITERYDFEEEWHSLRDPDKRVIKGSELSFSPAHPGGEAKGSQMWTKPDVLLENGITQSLLMFEEVLSPEGKSQKHYHQNEAFMYVLEGKGYEIHDGERYEWEAGDLVLIHGGCVHQHFSADPDNPCRVLIINPKPLYMFLNLIYQGHLEGPPTEPANDPNWTPPYPNTATEGDSHSPGGKTDE